MSAHSKMKSVLPRFPKIDKRLLGTWKSDRKRTFAEWNWRTGISPEKKEELKSIFGKLLITYTRSRVIWNLPYRKWVTARRYATLGADETSVAIVIFGKRHVKNAQKYDRINLEIVNEFWSELKIQQIHFTGNHYWISIGGGKNREFFRKIRRGKYTNSR